MKFKSSFHSIKTREVMNESWRDVLTSLGLLTSTGVAGYGAAKLFGVENGTGIVGLAGAALPVVLTTYMKKFAEFEESNKEYNEKNAKIILNSILKDKKTKDRFKRVLKEIENAERQGKPPTREEIKDKLLAALPTMQKIKTDFFSTKSHLRDLLSAEKIKSKLEKKS